MKAFEKRRAAAGQSGFTLIELLVVIAILGILAGVVVFAVGNTTDNAKVKACRVEARTIKTAVEAYRGNQGTADLPLATPGWGAQIVGSTDSGFLQDDPEADWTAAFDATGKLTSLSHVTTGSAKYASVPVGTASNQCQ